MYGIVVKLAIENAASDALMERLGHPEYRGYDSAGLVLQISRPHRARVPVIEPRACWAQGKPGRDGAVPWPCSTEQLQQRIEEDS